MKITEDEARTKSCPRRTDEVGFKCLGSRCMAWRWAPITGTWNGSSKFFVADNPSASTESEAGLKPEACATWEFSPCEIDPAGWVEPKEEADKRRRGYCGLAGIPEDAA